MGSSFEKSVKGATKIKAAPPKTKYIEHILVATHAGEAGVGEVFRSLSAQLRETAWTTVIKSLITIHFMIREGQPDVTLAYLSQHRRILATSAYTDAQSHGMTIRRYAEYLSERARAYKDTKVDWVRNKESRLEKLSVDKGLLRETEIVQAQLQVLLQCQPMDDEHDEINICVFRLLVLDLLALFQAVNMGMINILGTFFEMAKTDAERALDIYRTFVDQTDFVVNYLSVARQYEHLTRVEVPKLKHAPVNLGRQLEDYLKDPDFEIHRRQFIAEQAAKKKSGKSGTNSAPSRSPETAKIPDFSRPKTSSGPSISKPVSQAAPALPSMNKGLEQNLIDLFDDIGSHQTVQTINPPVGVQQQQQMVSPGFQPQMTGFLQQQQGVMPQATGFGTNPFQQQAFGAPVQQFAPMQAPMPTGAGFGGFTTATQAQAQPQIFQPQQTSNSPFGQPQQQQPAFLSQPPPSIQQPPVQLVPTATGTNPFRQSMLPSATGPVNSPKSTNPFARPTTSGGLVPSQTGKNPFIKHTSMIPQATGPVQLVPQATGTNPFRQSMMPQATGWGQQAAIGGGLDQVPTIPVFPRQGQQQTGGWQ